MWRSIDKAARRDPLDRQRNRRARAAAGAGADLRHQPLHARRGRVENGGVAVPSRTAADTIEDLSRAVDECLEQDVLVFSGGSSVGERDLILDVIAAKGEMLFHGIAVKPGKPTAFGRISGKLVFGMPGYPTSCLSNAYILLAPALRRIARLPDRSFVRSRCRCASRVASVPGRHQFYSVRIENGVAVPASRPPATSRACRRPMATSRFPAAVEVVDAHIGRRSSCSEGSWR